MNIRDFFETKPTFKRTTKYKDNQELKTKEYVNELVYNFGKIYLYVGLSDCFDDIYYIMIDSNGGIHYHSCVGELGTPLWDYMCEDKYKKFKKYFISSIKYQRNWRTSWDKSCYLPKPSEYLQVEYFIQDGLPIINELKTNIKDCYKLNLPKEEKTRIRKRFWNYFWHMFGFHHICERRYEYDELQVVNDEDHENNLIGEYNSVLTGVCDVCKRKIMISEGWCCNRQIWYKYKWLGKICKPFITFLDMYKRAK